MSEKVGVITTGGTIGSVLSGTAMSVDPNSAIVIQEIEKICKRRSFDVEVVTPINKNSEDLTPNDWGHILGAINDFQAAGVKRIVITHGTDTLAYTSAAIAHLFGRSDLRICLTGSFLALTAENSDGPLNLIAAFRAVTSDELENGVYVAFRTNERNTQASIIPALALKPMAFDELAFEGVYGGRTAYYSPKAGFVLEDNAPKVWRLPTLPNCRVDGESMERSAASILQLKAYPGLSLTALDPQKLTLLIIELYHSGTAASGPGPSTLVDFLSQASGRLPVICSAFPSAHINTPYESTVKLTEAGGIVLKDLQPHVVYVFAVLALAMGQSIAWIVDSLESYRFR